MSITVDPKEVLLKLCERLEKLPRRQIKDSQTHSYIEYDNVDCLIAEARAAIKE